MAKFRSIPHEIEAFQFVKGWVRPDWFHNAVRVGEASATWNRNDKHITIYGENQIEKAFLNDWVCLSTHGKIYTLKDRDFKSDYREIDSV